MYISKIKLENFRCFSGEHEIYFKKGLNYFVGNNNCGKTTIFRAIEFLKSSKTKESWITKGKESEDVTVEITISGEDLKEFLEDDSLKKYQPYLIEDSHLIIRRSSKSSTWIDSRGREKEILIKNIALFNPISGIYENPTGTDSVISALFDAQFVYSDLQNEDFQNFGKSTTIVSKLISKITEEFRKSAAWINFETAHKTTFEDKDLVKVLTEVQDKIEKIMHEQYGETKVEFSFGLPTIENFFKTGQILLEDNGIKTEVSEKGTGMQRALALTLIQVYSQIGISEREITKPIFFFIDEPETFLHPSAQDRLLESLNKLSLTNQIFITTHSPYLLKNFDNTINKLSIFSRKDGNIEIEDDISLNLFPYSPSWGEINYKAFNVISEEFHNELFGLLHNTAKDNNETFSGGTRTVNGNIACVDEWIFEKDPSNCTDENHKNVNPRSGYVDKSMSAYIRNYIDHPGDDNTLMNGEKREKPDSREIRKSIESMMKILEDLLD